MNIKSFHATWAGPFSGVTLDMEHMKGIWTISGNDADAPEEDYSNGVGKTSLYDLLAYSLSGKSIEDRQVGELVHDQAAQQGSNKKMLTEVLVDNIRIRRGQKPRRLEIHRMDPDGSEREDITSTASQEWLWEKWGINWDTLKFIMRFGGDENDLKSFAKANAETRRKIQDALIQADRITACLRASRKGAASIKSQCEVLVGRINDAGQRVESIKLELEDLKDRHKAFEEEVESKVQELEKFVKSWSKFDFEDAYRVADDYAAILSTIQELASQSRSLERQLDGLETKIASLTREIVEHEKSIARLSKEMIDDGPLERDVQRSYARLEQARMEVEKAKEIMKQRKPIERQLAEAERVVGEHQAEVRRFAKAIEEGTSPRAPLETKDIETSIKRLQEQIKEQQEVIDKTRLKAKSLSKKKAPSVFEAELKAAEKEQKRLQVLLAKIADVMESTKALKEDVACDACGQQITEDSKARVLARQAEEEALQRRELSQVEEDIKAIQRDLESARQQARDLAAAQREVDEAENKLADLRGDLEVERQKLDAVRQETLAHEKRLAEKEIAERSLKVQQGLLDGAKATVLRLKGQLAEMDDGGSKQELLDEADAIHVRATRQLHEVRQGNEKVLERIDKCRQAIKSADDRRKEAATEKANVKERLEETREKARLAKKRQESLLYDDGGEPEAREFLEKKEDRLRRSEEELAALKEKLENNDIKQLLAKKAKEHEQAIEIMHSMEAELDKQTALLPYYEYWVSAFKSEGIRSLAMKDLIPVLNKEMDRVMEHLEGKRARIQFDDDMGLVITDWETGDPTTYRKISGGMKKRVNISIACAFRETIRAASGCDLSLFVVDESADALDTPGKLGFVDLLQDMAQDSTIWVITHDKVLREALDNVASGNIHIEMRGGVSEAFVTHN